MKLRLWLLVLIAGLCLPAQAQEVDVTKLIANTKTFIFDNNKNTVKGYIYAELEEVTACCGSDRIYLEVNIDPSGYVKKVNALTGKNECFKQAAADIVKNVKWDASDFKGPKSIYFEIKPEVDCGEGRNNNYTQIEIFNNPLTHPEGVATAPAEGTAPATADPATTPPTTGDPVASNQTPQPTRSQSEPTRTTAAPGAPATRPQAEKPEETVVLPPGYAQPDEPSEADKEIEAARKRAEAERIAQDQEIQSLKDQMAQLREKAANQAQEDAAREKAEEEKQRRREAYIARRRAAQERARARQDQDRSLNNGEVAADGSVGGGGLFLDETEGTGEFAEGDSTLAGLSESERIRQEIASIEQQIREKEQAQQEREAEAQRIADENMRANEEIFRMYEEVSIKEEEAAQARDNEELAILEEDRIRAEEERRKQEEEYQQMMDEIRRLQEEADRTIAEVENQKRDMERLEEIQKTREQEIVLEQALREQERLRLLNEKERYLLGRSTIRPPADRTLIASEQDELDALIASLDVTAEADSEQVKLIQIINQLRSELQLVRYKLQKLEEEGGPGPEVVNGTSSGPETVNGTPTTPAGTNVASATPSPGRTVSGGNGKFKTAADDDSWKKLSTKEIVDPNLKVSDYVPDRPKPAPKQPVASPTPQGDRGIPGQDGPRTDAPATATQEKDPNDHSGTFWNGSGPKFEARTYVEGESKMKELIKEKLRAGGVCGLGQAAFSLTLDPQGNVVRYSVLAANSATVEFQLSTVLPTLKFNAVESRYNQTIYQEFKAEIICEGASDKVKLREVENIIKD